MTQINAMQPGVPSPYFQDPAVRRAARMAGGAGMALAGTLLTCAAGLVITGLVDRQYLVVVCIIALLPGLLGLGLLSTSRRILRGEIFGTTKATGVLVTMAGLVTLGTIGAIVDGPWPAKIVMVALAAGTIGTVVLVNRADRALKGQ